MMKKTIALFLAVLAVCSCFTFCTFAEDAEEPQKTPSGLYVGQQLIPGETTIRSYYDTCTSIVVYYGVDKADADNVTSALQAKFANDTVKGVARFRDMIASTDTDVTFSDGYTIKGDGDIVDALETDYNDFRTSDEIRGSYSEDELKALRIQDGLDIKIDYDYAHTTYNQYTSIGAWEITSVQDGESTLEIRVKAVFQTREPNEKEQTQEKLYTMWLNFLDKIGDVLLKIVPAIVSTISKLLGKN